MNGQVDGFGRANVTVSIRPQVVAPTCSLQAWIDTGFNGELVLPQKQIDELQLRPTGTLKAILADGSEIALQRYTCRIDWFGERREIEVVANDGEYPLIGVGLLLGHDLRISYRTGKISIE